MYRFTCTLLALFLLASSAWADKKITVGQLEDLLHTMQRDKKSDVEVATALKQLELSEELTRERMNSIVPLAPGPYSTEQIYVLEAQSADLIPPPSDLPATPAPDAAALKAILARAADYVAHSYDQLPQLAANRTTLRFQDNVETVGQSSGVVGSVTEVDTSSPGFAPRAYFVHYINSADSSVAFNRGAEKLPPPNPKIRWGANRMIALETPDPSLGAVFQEAAQSASIQWLRWELIHGKPAAVFSFSVSAKHSRLDVKVCCFPKIDQQGTATFYTATSAAALRRRYHHGGRRRCWRLADHHRLARLPRHHPLPRRALHRPRFRRRGPHDHNGRVQTQRRRSPGRHPRGLRPGDGGRAHPHPPRQDHRQHSRRPRRRLRRGLLHHAPHLLHLRVQRLSHRRQLTFIELVLQLQLDASCG